MQAKYVIKVQAIRSKAQAPRFYVNFPRPLAAAIGLQAGELVEWELLNRGELHLVRHQSLPPRAHKSSSPKLPSSRHPVGGEPDRTPIRKPN